MKGDTHATIQGDAFEKNLELVRRIEQLAASKGCTPAQLALACVLAQGDDTVPIPGTRRSQRLDENVESVDISLTEDELAEIDAVIPRDMVTGSRYPEEAMGLLDG